MGAMKTLDLELQELDAEVDITNADDVFDLVVDTRLSNKPLSHMMQMYVASVAAERIEVRCLFGLAEFVDAWDWHSANNGGK